MSTDSQALVPVSGSPEKRPRTRRGKAGGPAPDLGGKALAALRAELLDAIGLDQELLRQTVATQRDALTADRTIVTRDGALTEPDWQARLRAARDLQDLGIPRQHGNAAGSGKSTVQLEFPEWFRNLAESRARRG